MATQDTQKSAAESALERLGIESGWIVQEYSYDSDVDEAFRDLVAEATGEDLVDEDYGNVTDAALVWFRAEDAEDYDLADLLMDAQTLLDDGAVVWLMTLKAGRDGHVGSHEVQEAASVAGLHATSSFIVGTDWVLTLLVDKGRSK